jgi:hypothetical protein
MIFMHECLVYFISLCDEPIAMALSLVPSIASIPRHSFYFGSLPALEALYSIPFQFASLIV